MDRLNNIESSIDFNYELETNNPSYFLDILLINNKLDDLKVHHEFTNKNDHIHLYSHHDTKMKSRIMKGFYFSDFRICTPPLNFSMRNLTIENSFIQL